MLEGAGSPGGGGGTDPDFASVVLLLGFEGTNGDTTTTDDSASAHTFTFVGSDSEISSTQSKFGSTSLFNGNFSSNPEVADHDDFEFDTGEFTMEGWFYMTELPATQATFLARWGAASNYVFLFDWDAQAGGRFRFVSSRTGDIGAAQYLFAAGTPAINTWFHLAVDRDASNVFRIYKDGVMLGSLTHTDRLYPLGNSYLDVMHYANNRETIGYADEIRLTKGVARYADDSGFTPPTSAFPRS